MSYWWGVGGVDPYKGGAQNQIGKKKDNEMLARLVLVSNVVLDFWGERGCGST